jgi:general nucleoside transport system permease protein
MTREKIWDFFEPIVAVAVGVGLALLAVKALGDSPMLVLDVLFKSAFGSKEDFGTTLFYATPLIFTGLSVMIALHAGLFNIGAEGQLLMGSMAATIFGLTFPNLPMPVTFLFGIFFAILGGALYGLIPGILRAKRGSHEVINTIMLNFVASGITSYLALYAYKTQESQSPETAALSEAYRLPQFSYFGNTNLNFSFVLALGCVALSSVFLWKTKLGFQLRMVGENPTAARQYGIKPERFQILAMVIAGGLAGMVGVNEILGSAGKFRIGFSPDYGFMGIAVALLGRNRPLGVLFSALLFGALHKGTTDLDLETEKVTRDFSLVLQALIILSVSVSAFVSSKLKTSVLARLKKIFPKSEKGVASG